ncbi:hypothetical protein G5714_008989 [Onychostoma macrolepis]|uniref:Uncharacterized protein n=1 Tax=Onychostoma macrolepis TaxID=369639 RepID=A0A7J6CQW3_9TELE|nr:hypothetical protein G5714_008989 [Onychostoma macrolepis]
MESNIGNACLKIVEEAARRHGKNVHIVDLYAVPTWKDKNVDPEHSLPVSFFFFFCYHDLINRESFIGNRHKRRDLECFPQQSTGNSCGIYMLMYALSACTSWPLTFTEEEVPLIRQWWCIQLMERFCLEGHGQRFAHWAEEASQLLQGTLEPVFRVSNSTTTKQTPSRRVVVEEDTDKVQQPTTVRDLHTAWYWVHNHRDLFRGEVTEPAFLQMNSEDQQNALKKALESEF